MKRSLLFFFLVFPVLSALAQELPYRAADYSMALKELTDVMVNDVTSPVAASRYYAYATIAGNEIAAALDPGHPSFQQVLNDFPAIPRCQNRDRVAPDLAVLYATLKMGELLLPSGYLLEEPRQQLISEAASRHRISKARIQASLHYADTVIKTIMAYSASDRFASLSALPDYTPFDGPAYWQPTPPAYMSPVEPNWNRLRPFLLDSASQFRPAAPVPYSEEKDSKFYHLVTEVYEATREMSSEQIDIASFWDCNPFVLHIYGHIDFGMKKISPGGHWIGITGIACDKKGLDLRSTVRVHALVAVALADAFISCWDEKFRSNRVRPETVINRLMDPEWMPLLQTPPFPEYTSGHSVASTAAACLLTRLFGEKFAYTDTVEAEFGLPERHFTSFIQASEEAAISRLYGGIHYRDAIEAGITQGRQIAAYIIGKLEKDIADTRILGAKAE